MSNLEISSKCAEIKEIIVSSFASKSEYDFIEGIKKIESLKDISGIFDSNNFFTLLKELDKILLGEKALSDRVCNKNSGYFDEKEKEEILKLLYIQRYVNAHDEDQKTEKIKEVALQNFISDMYDSGVHFFEEVLQNIDDAIGRKQKRDNINKGEVLIRWNDKKISFEYPDRGFSFYDLMAITSLGNSIKKGDIDQASIGEKGIGFKSVFSVASNISIQSKYFSFDIEYDEKRKTSVLQPSKIISQGTGEEKSTLTITFNDRFQIDTDNGFKYKLKEWLFGNSEENLDNTYLNYSPFLFLKNVSEIKYEDGAECKTVEIKRTKIETVSGFSTIKINDNKYLLFKHSLNFNKKLIENRWGTIAAIENKEDEFSIDRPIEIAFPILEEGMYADGKMGLFYSYLPTEMKIDFPIYINVDVHLKASRGRIREKDFQDGSEWNKYILDNISDILVETFIRLTKAYKVDKDIETVAGNLYIYINKQTTPHYFKNELIKFYDEIMKKEIFLNISDEFVKKENIWLSNIKDENEWNDFTRFCLKKAFPNESKQYAKNYKWYRFAKGNQTTGEPWESKVLKVYGGIKTFYNNTEIEDVKEKNRIVLNVLEKAKNMLNNSTLSILFVENDNGFQICSKEEVNASGKVVFFHSENESLKDEISVYIAKAVFKYKEVEDSQDYSKYQKLLEGVVDKKDWKDYVENIVKKMVQDLESFSIYECVMSVSSYLRYITLDEIKTLTIPNEIKKKCCQYIIPSAPWEKYNLKGEIAYRKAIANYIEDVGNDKLDYVLLKISELSDLNADTDKLIEFLLKLGVKAGPGNLENDILSQNIMPKYTGIITDAKSMKFIYPGDTEYKYLEKQEEVKLLQEYLVETVNDKNSVDKKKILEIFSDRGLDFKNIIFFPKDIIEKDTTITVHPIGPYGGRHALASYWVWSFNKIANEDVEYFNGERKVLNLNIGSLMFADSEEYPNFTLTNWNWSYEVALADYNNTPDGQLIYDENNTLIIKNIIQNPINDMLDKLRWIIIWNKVFSVTYAWHNDVCKMNPIEFVSCHKYLVRKDIDKLLPKGYLINWMEGTPVDIEKEFQDTLVEYICNEFEVDFEQNIFKESYCLPLTEEACIFLDKYDKLSEKPYKYFIGIRNDTRMPKTDYVCAILQRIIGLKLLDTQRLEIADIVKEIKKDNKKKIIGLKNTTSVFEEAVFRDSDLESEYIAMISEGKKLLPSVWKKAKSEVKKTEDWGMKEWMCEPFRVNGHCFQGYGCQCPICGSAMRHQSISGMKFIKRIENADIDSKQNLPYLYLISCLNCADMIERADKVKIIDYDGKSLKEALNHFEEVCYCADNFHIYNHSKMKTMKLVMEIDNHEFVEHIKISFLHMLLFLKLWKK